MFDVFHVMGTFYRNLGNFKKGWVYEKEKARGTLEILIWEVNCLFNHG